jgi:hypothetical protein
MLGFLAYGMRMSTATNTEVEPIADDVAEIERGPAGALT